MVAKAASVAPAGSVAAARSPGAPTVPLLAANYSQALMRRLLADGGAVDVIKVSEFDRPEFWDDYAAARSHKPLILHGLGHGARPGNPGFRAVFGPAALRAALAATASAYVSAHLEHFSMEAETLSPAAFLEALTADVAAVREAAGMPVHLENGHSYRPVRGRPRNPDFISDPSYIAAALAATGSRLLLDLAHVRIAAWHRGQRPSAYLSALPLDLVDEVHVVGTATVDGELRDKHVEMDEDDYAALAFVLERAPVNLVTLEYGGVSGSVLDARSNPEALARQLGRLRQVLAGARGAQGR